MSDYLNTTSANGRKDARDHTSTYYVKTNNLVQPAERGDWPAENLKKHGNKRWGQCIMRILYPA